MAQVGDTVMILMAYPDRKVIAWDGREYLLEKDVEKFIPFELAANYFGDPRALGAMQSVQDHKRRVGWIPDRATEVRRLRVLYGVQHGDEASVYLPDGLMDKLPSTGDWPERKRHWLAIDANIPRVEMFDLDTRQRLHTVLEDPLGEHVTPAHITVTREQQLESKVARLEELVASMVGAQRPGEGLVTSEGVIAGRPDGQSRQPSPAEQALAASRREGGGDDDAGLFGEPDPSHEIITSERSGAAGLPADKS